MLTCYFIMKPREKGHFSALLISLQKVAQRDCEMESRQKQ